MDVDVYVYVYKQVKQRESQLMCVVAVDGLVLMVGRGVLHESRGVRTRWR